MSTWNSRAGNRSFRGRAVALCVASATALAAGFAGTYVATTQSARAVTDYPNAVYVDVTNVPAGCTIPTGWQCVPCDTASTSTETTGGIANGLGKKYGCNASGVQFVDQTDDCGSCSS